MLFESVFLLLFLIGSIGFTAMVMLGAFHGVGHHGHTGPLKALPSHGHLVGGHGHVLPGHTSHAPAQVHHNSGHAQSEQNAEGRGLFISPLDIFSLCLGGGAAGLLLTPYLPAFILPICGIAGAVFFNFGVVRPLMGFLFRFASKPSDGLEGTIAQSAEAISGFDAQGRGLVRMTLDGQNIQLLAHLDDTELQKGVKVHKGEQLMVIDVDAAKNTCRVTRELAE